MNIGYNQAFDFLLSKIKNYRGNMPLVIAFDGRSASGKTSMADKLKSVLGVSVIHTDDFFRPRDINGNLCLSQYDGNFDLQRFKTEVVDKLKSKKEFSYGVFDCKSGKIDSFCDVPISNCYIVEGAYSLNPNLGEYADIKVFFDVSADVQKQRIISRNGENAYDRFSKIWIPAEERYLSHYNIRLGCDVILSEE